MKILRCYGNCMSHLTKAEITVTFHFLVYFLEAPHSCHTGLLRLWISLVRQVFSSGENEIGSILLEWCEGFTKFKGWGKSFPNSTNLKFIGAATKADTRHLGKLFRCTAQLYQFGHFCGGFGNHPKYPRQGSTFPCHYVRQGSPRNIHEDGLRRAISIREKLCQCSHLQVDSSVTWRKEMSTGDLGSILLSTLLTWSRCCPLGQHGPELIWNLVSPTYVD